MGVNPHNDSDFSYCSSINYEMALKLRNKITEPYATLQPRGRGKSGGSRLPEHGESEIRRETSDNEGHVPAGGRRFNVQR